MEFVISFFILGELLAARPRRQQKQQNVHKHVIRRIFLVGISANGFSQHSTLRFFRRHNIMQPASSGAPTTTAGVVF
jgi:hypothetical protein